MAQASETVMEFTHAFKLHIAEHPLIAGNRIHCEWRNDTRIASYPSCNLLRNSAYFENCKIGGRIDFGIDGVRMYLAKQYGGRMLFRTSDTKYVDQVITYNDPALVPGVDDFIYKVGNINIEFE